MRWRAESTPRCAMAACNGSTTCLTSALAAQGAWARAEELSVQLLAMSPFSLYGDAKRRCAHRLVAHE